MKRSLTLYIGGVIAAAAVALLVALVLAPPGVSGHTAALAVMLAALAFVAHLAPVAVASKRGIVLDTSIQMVALLALSPGEAALVCALATALGNVYRGRSWFNSLFNAAQVALSVVIAGAVYRLLAPAAPAGLAEHGRDLLAMACAAVVLFLVGELAVDGAIAIQRRASPRRAWWRSHRQTLLAHLLLAAIGVAAAPAIEATPWLALALVAPVAALRAALRSSHRSDDEAVRVAEEMAAGIEAQQPALSGSSARLTALAGDVARRRGLSEEECRRIELAARLHHLGAAALAPGMVLEPDGTGAAASAYRRRHQDDAAALIVAGFGLPAVADVVRYHHESFDGLGSPHGLAGVDIPSSSRILGVCEAWVTLTARAGARPALTTAQALTVLRAGAGTQWDPSLVELLAGIVATSGENTDAETRYRHRGGTAPLAAAG